MTGTYGCRMADAAANYRMQNHGAVGVSNRAAAERMLGGGCPSTSSSATSAPTGATPGCELETREALEAASKSGQGITRPELEQIASDAFARCGQGATLSDADRQVFAEAVSKNLFARRSTAELALELSQGKISPAELGARAGRSA